VTTNNKVTIMILKINKVIINSGTQILSKRLFNMANLISKN